MIRKIIFAILILLIICAAIFAWYVHKTWFVFFETDNQLVLVDGCFDTVLTEQSATKQQATTMTADYLEGEVSKQIKIRSGQKELLDGWGKPIKFKIDIEPDCYVLTTSSAGYDGIYDTKDDMERISRFSLYESEDAEPETGLAN